MRQSMPIGPIIGTLLCLGLFYNSSSSASLTIQDNYPIQSAGSKDWICTQPVISFMGNKFDVPMMLKLRNGPVRVQALQLSSESKEGFYSIRLISFINETDKAVSTIKLALTLFAEDAPETVLQGWESNLIVFSKSLTAWRSIIDATEPHPISKRSLESSSLKDNFELGTIHLNSVLPGVSKGTKGKERLMIEVKVSEIIYEDGTIWGRN